MNEKRYYRIGEVCKIAGIKPYILRYWEREFRSIKPDRSLKNQRMYPFDALHTIVQIKKLLDQGYTLDSVKKAINISSNNNGKEMQAGNTILEDIKRDLQSVKSLLEY